MRLILILVILCTFHLFGQPPEPWKEADAVVVGEIVSGQLTESGGQVHSSAVLQVRRALSGPLLPGTSVPFSWSFPIRGMWPKTNSQSMPQASGLWLLKRTGDAWAPLPMVLSVPGALGGVFLPVPAGALNPEYFYAPDSTLEVRIAMEVGAALELAAETEGAKLNLEASPNAQGVRLSQAQVQFRDWCRWLDRLPPDALLPLQRRFAASSQPSLRALGLIGLIRRGDSGAVLQFEKDFTALAVTPAALELASHLRQELVQKDPATLQAVGRMIVSETRLQSLESRGSSLLAGSRQLEAVPFLAAMLSHPDRDIRSNTVMALCMVLRSDPGAPRGLKLWDPATMNGQCPNHSPLADPEEVAAQVRFWQDWWAQARQPVLQLAGMEDAQPPARYRNPMPEERPVPDETKFRLLAGQHVAWQASQNRAGVGVLPGLRLNEDDAKLLAGIFADFDRMQQAWTKSLQSQQQAWREQRKPIDRKAMDEWNRQGVEMARQSLEQARRSLSSEGWAALQKFMQEMHVRSFGSAAPRPPGQ
ncbi:hypothetical protein [Paludibaculum fermentans]|uniref:hypothetical protein n=1 Tax=Paludibaculum fermentans TaxID=1473598 RepID=UPI003EBC0F93